MMIMIGIDVIKIMNRVRCVISCRDSGGFMIHCNSVDNFQNDAGERRRMTHCIHWKLSYFEWLMHSLFILNQYCCILYSYLIAINLYL